MFTIISRVKTNKDIGLISVEINLSFLLVGSELGVLPFQTTIVANHLEAGFIGEGLCKRGGGGGLGMGLGGGAIQG